MKVLDLFCGCGGLTKGLEDAGFNIIAGIDIWEIAIQSYKSNFNHIGLCKDLTLYNPEEFVEETNIREIDMIVGGIPCQGFSMGGRREVGDSRNSLFKYYFKYVKYFKPKIILIENVIGILSMKDTDGELIINKIIKKLKNYKIGIFKLSAADYEVPQNRRRVIIIGYRKYLNLKPTKPTSIGDIIPVSSILEDNVGKEYYLSEKAINGINLRKEKMSKENKGFGAQFLKLDKPSYTIPARYYKDGYDALIKYEEQKIRKLTILELKRIQTLGDNFILCGSKKEQIMQIGNAVASRFAYHIGLHIKKELEL